MSARAIVLTQGILLHDCYTYADKINNRTSESYTEAVKKRGSKQACPG